VVLVCCFASVMGKQVNYQPHSLIYGPYGGRVRPLLVYQIWSGQSYPFRNYKGPKVWN